MDGIEDLVLQTLFIINTDNTLGILCRSKRYYIATLLYALLFYRRVLFNNTFGKLMF